MLRLQKLIFSKPVSNTYGMYIRIQRTKELKDLRVLFAEVPTKTSFW